MSQARAVPAGRSGAWTLVGATGRLPVARAGGAGVVGSSGSDGAVASGVGVTELGEGLAWGAGLCPSASSSRRLQGGEDARESRGGGGRAG